MTRTANDTTSQITQNWTQWTDEELLLEYRNSGIREAFEALVKRYERVLYNSLYEFLGDADNAEDVFQKTFMAILRNCDQFDANKKFFSWMYKIATHTAIDHKRSMKRFSAIDIDSPQGNEPNTSSIAESTEGNEREPFANMMESETASVVRKAVASLPDKMRQAVSMIYFQGLSCREAAAQMGVHNATVDVRLRNAYTKLSFLLKEA